MGMAAFVFGVFQPGDKKRDLQLAFSAAIAHAALAFYKDGRNLGLISKRMSGLFGLPQPELIFLVMAVLAFVTVWLGLRAGKIPEAIRKSPPDRTEH